MQIPFPRPRRYGENVVRWEQYELDCYIALIAGREPPERPDKTELLRDTDVAELFGVSRASIWRWCRGNAKAAA